AAQAADFAAGIDWGDGGTSTGTVVADPAVAGRFDVSGGHTYFAAGSSPLVVMIADAAGGTATAARTFVVADAAITASAATLITPGATPFLARVGSFTDANPAARPGDFQAAINW